MIMTNDIVSTTNTSSLLPVDQQVLLAIKKRYDLNPKQKELIFELGGFEVALNNKNDYLAILAALGRLKEGAGIDYTIEDTYVDRRGRTQHYTLYDSRLCKISIKDVKKFEDYCRDKLGDNLPEDGDQHKGGKPYCVKEKGWGYLKFGKFGKKNKIGLPTSRPFRLLQCLLEPLGITRTVNSVFEAIRSPKDNNDSRLTGWNTTQRRKIDIIKNTIKELQKGNKLEGRIRFEFNEEETQIKAQLVD